MGISFSGMASGIDTATIISQLMTLEKAPLDKMQEKKTGMSSEQGIFRSINTKLSTLRSAAADLTLKSSFNLVSAANTNDKVVGINASDTASTGTYTIDVTALAKQHVVQTDELNMTATNPALEGQKFTIYHKDLASPLDITVSGNNYGEMLESIKNQINSKAKGLSATVVETTPGQKSLILTATQTGAANSIEFGNAVSGSKVTIDDADGVLNALGLIADATDPTQVDASRVAQAHAEAVFKVNGVNVTKSTNTVTDVISGATINLLDTGTAKITVKSDADKVTAKVKAFVDAYNDVLKTVSANIDKGKSLQGDATLRQLSTTLNTWVNRIVGGTSADFSMMAFVGLEVDKGRKAADMDGTIVFDSAQFKKKLQENPDEMFKLFAVDVDSDDESDSNDGIAFALNKNLDQYTNTIDGIISRRIKGYDTDIRDLNDRMDNFQLHLDQKEAQLKRKFTAMEVALSSLKNQQSWMSGQLSALQK